MERPGNGKALTMKLYGGGRAPNPRRVRIFLAEKGIQVPTEQVDLGALQQRTEAYTAINPMQRVPALVLDDGTVIAESIAILPLLRGGSARSTAIRRRHAAKRARRNVESAGRASSLLFGGERVSTFASGHEPHGGSSGAAMGGSEQAACDAIS